MRPSLSDIPTLRWNWSMSTVLLDHHQKVFDTHSAGNTLPRNYLQIAFDALSGIYLEKLPEYQLYKVLSISLLVPWNWPCKL